MSKQIYILTKGGILTPNVLDYRVLRECSYVITSRVTPVKDTAVSDIEHVLKALENADAAVLITEDYPIEYPPFFRPEETSRPEITSKLSKIGYENIDTAPNLLKVSDTLTLQHGDLRPENVIVSEKGVYLVDLDTAGLYPRHYERFSLVSCLGIPLGIEDDLFKVIQSECIVFLCSTINTRTENVNFLIESIKTRIDLVIEGRISGLNNVALGISIRPKHLQ